MIIKRVVATLVAVGVGCVASSAGAIPAFARKYGVLLPERTNRARATLAIAAASVLAGLLGERFLLVLPSLGRSVDIWTLITGPSAAAATIGLFVVTVGAPLAPAPAAPVDKAAAKVA